MARRVDVGRDFLFELLHLARAPDDNFRGVGGLERDDAEHRYQHRSSHGGRSISTQLPTPNRLRAPTPLAVGSGLLALGPAWSPKPEAESPRRKCDARLYC